LVLGLIFKFLYKGSTNFLYNAPIAIDIASFNHYFDDFSTINNFNSAIIVPFSVFSFQFSVVSFQS